MLSSSQIQYRAQIDPTMRNVWLGVFPADQIPKHITQYPSGLIANTDPSTKPGMHWISMYFPNKKTSEFFDSYGLPPSYYSKYFSQVLSKNGEKLKRNTNDLQSLTSDVCGYYALNYIYRRSQGESMEQIVDNPKLNDNNVKRFINRHLPPIKKIKIRRHPHNQTIRRRHEVHHHLNQNK